VWAPTRMDDGTQELQTIVGTGVEPRQTCLDARLVNNVRLALSVTGERTHVG